MDGLPKNTKHLSFCRGAYGVYIVESRESDSNLHDVGNNPLAELVVGDLSGVRRYVEAKAEERWGNDISFSWDTGGRGRTRTNLSNGIYRGKKRDGGSMIASYRKKGSQNINVIALSGGFD